MPVRCDIWASRRVFMAFIIRRRAQLFRLRGKERGEQDERRQAHVARASAPVAAARRACLAGRYAECAFVWAV